jgi:hypothetical protein
LPYSQAPVPAYLCLLRYCSLFSTISWIFPSRCQLSARTSHGPSVLAVVATICLANALFCFNATVVVALRGNKAADTKLFGVVYNSSIGCAPQQITGTSEVSKAARLLTGFAEAFSSSKRESSENRCRQRKACFGATRLGPAMRSFVQSDSASCARPITPGRRDAAARKSRRPRAVPAPKIWNVRSKMDIAKLPGLLKKPSRESWHNSKVPRRLLAGASSILPERLTAT